MASLWEITPPKTPRDLAQILLDNQVVTSDQIRIAALEAKRRKRSLEASLVALGFISESAMAAAMAQADGVEHLDLSHAVLDPQLTKHLTKTQALHHQILPLSFEEKALRLGMVDPHDIQSIDFARGIFQDASLIKPVIISQSDFLEALDRCYGYEMSFHKLLVEIESQPDQGEGGESYQNPTVRLVDAILLDAVKAGASDIHFEPEGAFMRIRYRIDGLLQQIRTLHSSHWPALCVRLKVIASMNIAESRRPQNGRFSIYVGPREVDFRASSHPTVYGENIVLRILDKTRSLMALDQLGYSEEIINNIHQALLNPEGMIVITGPTGSGKTTSLYSMLNDINTLDINIMTLEEPIEYLLPLVRQTPIQEPLSFADGVKSILRQDPDVILIGEIRDEATAQMALRASMTGHRVFTTLHTQDALGVLGRLEDLGLKTTLLAGNLTAIIAQRLVRRLCKLCKKAAPVTSSQSKLLKCERGTLISIPIGCPACHQTGFQGRMALAEVINFNRELDDLILCQTHPSTLFKVLHKQGYRSLAHEGCQQVLAHETSLCEISRCIALEGNE